MFLLSKIERLELVFNLLNFTTWYDLSFDFNKVLHKLGFGMISALGLLEL